MPSDKEIAVLGVGMHPWGKWGRNFVEYGVHAARAAGIRGVAVGHRRASGTWTGESFYLGDLRDLSAVLHILGFSR